MSIITNFSRETGTFDYDAFMDLEHVIISLNEGINSLEKEINLSKAYQEYNSKLEREKTSIIDNYVKNINYQVKELNKENKEIKDKQIMLEKKIESIKIKVVKEDDLNEENINFEEINIKKINNIFLNKNKEIESLENSNKKLKKINEYLSEKIRIREEKEKKEKPKKCQNCGILYLESTNSDTSCLYHPGKIKYFSCRQCGADEYYTCCLKCRECCSSCKKGKHIS